MNIQKSFNETNNQFKKKMSSFRRNLFVVMVIIFSLIWTGVLVTFFSNRIEQIELEYMKSWDIQWKEIIAIWNLPMMMALIPNHILISFLISYRIKFAIRYFIEITLGTYVYTVIAMLLERPRPYWHYNFDTFLCIPTFGNPSAITFQICFTIFTLAHEFNGISRWLISGFGIIFYLGIFFIQYLTFQVYIHSEFISLIYFLIFTLLIYFKRVDIELAIHKIIFEKTQSRKYLFYFSFFLIGIYVAALILVYQDPYYPNSSWIKNYVKN